MPPPVWTVPLDATMRMAVATLAADAFTAVCPGGVYDVVPQGTPQAPLTFPLARLMTRFSTSGLRTFGTSLYSVELRVRCLDTSSTAAGGEVGTGNLDAMVATAATLFETMPSLVGWMVHDIDVPNALDPVEGDLGGTRVQQRDLVTGWLVEATP